MNCLVCNSALSHLDHEGVSLDGCPEGHGVWLDQGELQRVVLSVEKDQPVEAEDAALAHSANSGLTEAVHELQSEGPRDCPVCNRAMDKFQYDSYSGITVDSCTEHGVWLDGGELERIEAYAEGTRRLLTESGSSGGSVSYSIPGNPDFFSGIAQGSVAS